MPGWSLLPEMMLEMLKKVLDQITLILRYLRLEWKMALLYTVLFILVVWGAASLLVAFADVANMECHTYHIQSTVPGTGQPAVEDKDICHDRRDK